MESKVPQEDEEASDRRRFLLFVRSHHLFDLCDGLARVQALRGRVEENFILKIFFEEVAAVEHELQVEQLPWDRSWCSS